MLVKMIELFLLRSRKNGKNAKFANSGPKTLTAILVNQTVLKKRVITNVLFVEKHLGINQDILDTKMKLSMKKGNVIFVQTTLLLQSIN